MATPKKVLVTVKKYNVINDRVMTLDFKPEKRMPNFKPGQFLHLTLDEYDYSKPWPESRVFSIASSPSERKKLISLIISKQGKYTGRIINEINNGKQLWIKLPYGDFTIKDRLSDSNVFIAEGTGVSPFLSILKTKYENPAPIKLYYGIRSADYFIDKDFLINKNYNDDNFEMEVFIEEKAKGDNKYKKGMLSIQYIFDNNKNEKCNYFLSGPKSMIDYFSQFLIDKKVNKNRIIVDEWE